MAGASVDLEGTLVVGAKDPDDMQAIRRFAVAYLRNDERARIKKAINLALGSAYVEEKSYQDCAQRT
ncbi:hypothetical protein [Stenotrophomonas sp. 3diitr2024]|uniref:hypothetical protein n=1 Tax=Stenotrophomonas sp. 3diitr2024 TaxID=3345115 RepID=UPI0035CC25A8